ncbi:MAG: phage protein Gp27 family protein [Tepidisphaeraceae bacterium]
MPRHFKVEDELSAEDLEALKQFARDPSKTYDNLHEWVQAHGYVNISRTAVGNWRQKFGEELIAERMQASGGMARAMIEAAKESGGLAVPDAAILAVAQRIFEAASKAGGDEDEAASLNKMALGLQRLMLAKSRVESTRTEFVEREKVALDEARKVAAGGGSGDAVADKVAELLGVK